MGNQTSINKISYEDIQFILNKSPQTLVISTLDHTSQNCLIPKTVKIDTEVNLINTYLTQKEIKIVIYGRNCNDESVYKKYIQLQGLGFTNVYVYTGGLFEWLCLQDIYGKELFPTTTQELDILKYKPNAILTSTRLLTDSH